MTIVGRIGSRPMWAVLLGLAIWNTSAFGRVTSISLNEPCVLAGQPISGRVTVRPASLSICRTDPLLALETVTFSSNSADATVARTSLTIDRCSGSPPGADFVVNTRSLLRSRTVTITARDEEGNEVATRFELLSGFEMLESLSLNPNVLLGGTVSEATVGLACKAPPGGWPVTLSTNHSAAELVTNPVTILAGKTSASAFIKTHPVLSSTPVTVTAASSGTTRAAELLLRPGSLDLSVRKIEVTQGIQYLDDPFGEPDNSLPLVRNKPTAARVFLRANTPLPIDHVPVRLRSRPCGAGEASWVEHAPLWPTALVRDTLLPLEQRRTPSSAGQRAHNVSFVVDGAFVPQGCREFQAEVNAEQLFTEMDHTNNIWQEEFAFHPTRNLNIKFVRIDWCPDCPFDESPRYKPSWSKIDPMVAYLEKVFPTDRIRYWKAHREINVTWFTPFKDFSKERTWGWVLVKLDALSVFTDDPVTMHYYGLLDARVPNGNIGGYAHYPGLPRSCAGVAGVGSTAAQEIAHNLGRRHAPCPLPEESGTPADLDSAWPDMTNPRATIGHVGFDVDTGVALDPRAYEDFMGYCSPDWVSPYTYLALYEEHYRIGNEPPEEANDPLDHLVIRGVFDFDGLVFLAPLYHRIMPPRLNFGPGVGPMAVNLRAADGRMLLSRRFTIDVAASGDSHGGAFTEILPYHEETAHIEVMVAGPQGDEMVASAQATANHPTVDVLTPNGGEHLATGRPYTVEWAANDADGDMLHSLVLYSHDEGTTWEALAADLIETSYELNVDELPGTDRAMVRVIVSDGVNSSHDDSDATFVVDRKVPEAVIHLPTDGTILSLNGPHLLRGSGIDPDDGSLPDGALLWTSSRDGALGSGAQVAANLTQGPHAITLEVQDSDGLTASRTIRVSVGMPGDCDLDGDVDLGDFLVAAGCYTGPAGTLSEPQCSCSDLDSDGDVDLADIVALQTALTGAQ